MQTHVSFVLDSSGSMQNIAEDTKGGFNSFLADQRDEEGNATVTLIDFNTNVDVVYEAQDIEEAPELDSDTYTPSGQTALHDAIITAIDTASARIEELDDEEKPETVVVVVLTDGQENASETPGETVRERVEQQQEEHGWEFLFIGANQDAALTAEGIGMDSGRALSMQDSGEGTRAAYESTSTRISNARQQGTTGTYTDADRKRQQD